jgi:hypothetical protein
MLGAAGWCELASIALAALGRSTCVPGVLASPPSGRTLVTESTSTRRTGQRAGRSAALAGDVVGHSVLAAALARMPIRVERTLARAWAVIAAAEAAPSILLRADADTVIDLAADHFIRPKGQAASGFLDGDRSPVAATFDAMPPVTQSHRSESPNPESEDNQSDVADTDRTDASQTLWAGTLFFLNTAAAAGIPDEAFTDPLLGRYPLWRILRALMQSMVPIPADDPVLDAFGGRSRHPTPLTDEEVARVDTFASQWIARTAERMDLVEEDPADVCLRVALRRGSIVAEPGWIDVHLDLDDVDVDVRCAGLDFDPGWIPWLGCVVRFCYD